MADMGLGKQIGPLPLGAWLGIIVGGLGIGYFINRSQGSKAPESQLLAESGVGTGGQQLLYEPPVTAVPVESEKTNLSWGRDATNWLISTGQDPYTSDLAIRKYLQGEPLTIAEKAMLALVLARFGAPPEALPTVDPTPPVTPPPTTTPPAATDTYAIHLTGTPRNPVGTKPFTVSGIILKNGKPVIGVVSVTYRKPSAFSGTRPLMSLVSNPWGNWVFTYPGTNRYTAFYFTYGGQTVQFNASPS